MTTRALGKEALLDAAAVLFDEQGVDAVSLHRINQRSGHRNRSAASYHFGDRDAVVRSLVDRGMAPLDLHRTRLLDELEALEPAPGPRAVLQVAVTPPAASLATPEGRRHLRFCGQLLGHPRYNAEIQDVLSVNPSLLRCAVHLRPCVAHLPDDLRIERVAQIAAFVIRSIADQARLMDATNATRRPLPLEDFSANLVELALAMLAAPRPATA